MAKNGTTTESVYLFLQIYPNSSLEEIAEALHISSRSNVRYHLLKLAAAGRVDLPVGGKHRMFRVVQP